MGNISKLPKDRMIRPSVIGAVDKINEIIDDVNETDDDLATLTDKVEGLIVEGGEPNVIESVSLNGEPLPVVNKNVDVSTITTKSTTGPAYGPLLSVTAKGHAEQDSTTGKNLIPPMYYRSNNTDFVANEGTHEYRMRTSSFAVSANTVYTVSGMPSGTRLIGARCFDSAQQNLGDALVSGLNITTLANTAYMFILFGDDNNTYTVDTKQVFIDSVQLELGSTATTYEPYTGGIPSPNPDYPQEISVVRGRNLLERFAFSSQTRNGITWTVNDDGSISLSGTATADSSFLIVNKSQYDAGVEPGVTYTASGGDGQDVRLQFWSNVTGAISDVFQTATFSLSGTESDWNVALIVKSGTTVNKTVYPQLELGSTVHPYVPYGYVGLDVTADGTTTTTPIPLPSRGWVGSLPDGTHDALSIDGAGKVTWELADEEVTFDGSSDEAISKTDDWRYTCKLLPATRKSVSNEVMPLFASRFVAKSRDATYTKQIGVSTYYDGAYMMFVPTGEDMTIEEFRAWLQANHVTVLYPLATPTTVEVGHVDLPDIPEGAVVSIPELEGLGVESWTSDAVARYVRAWVERLSTPSTLLPAGE